MKIWQLTGNQNFKNIKVRALGGEGGGGGLCCPSLKTHKQKQATNLLILKPDVTSVK